MQFPSVTPGAQPDGVGTGWWVSIWQDWSSFGPDAIVGVATGLVVAGVVAALGRWIKEQTLREIRQGQQERAVEAGNLLLRGDFSYPRSASPALLPAGDNLTRLRDIVRAVPRGKPSQPVVGFEWLVAVDKAYERLEAAAETLLAKVKNYGGSSSSSGVAEALLIRIWDLGNVNLKYAPWPLTTEPPLLGDWNAFHYDRTPLAPIAGNLDDDHALRDDVNEYLRARRMLLLTHRAFFTVQRTFETAVAHYQSGDSPGTRGSGRTKKLSKRAFSSALRKANAEAREIVTRAPEQE